MGPPSDEGGNAAIAFPIEKERELQWGRPPMRAETPAGGVLPLLLDRASMGPPSDEGGNIARRLDGEHDVLASMGPPSDEGGNLGEVHVPGCSTWLQWGRPPMRAETNVDLTRGESGFNGAALR